MAEYPGSERETRVAEPALLRLVTRIFEGCGMAAEDALLLGGSLVAADLRAIHSHGVLRVPDYAAKLLDHGVDPRGAPGVVRDSGAALVVDGGNSMGQIASTFAMRKAIERARTLGVALAAVRGSNHCGAMFYYASMALEEDMIGLCATNALPTMAPWGGLDKIVGINPLAVAIPAEGEPPVVLDAAFSYSSHGKIRVYQQKGLPIPSTWAFDQEGRPTTDAARALQGLLQPIGEYKGVGLAIVMGLLASMLSGASYGTGLGNMVDGPAPGADGHFFLAIRVAAFEDVDRFKRRVGQAVRQIRTSRRAAGVQRLFAPGGLEAEMASRYRAEGIPLNAATLDGLRASAARTGVEFALE
jgi:LDH2 family malate/lactate/ureidoglycolate dehydrogenase